MKKALLIALALFGLLTAQVLPAFACAKIVDLVSTGDGDMRIETEENIIFRVTFWINNWSDDDWTDAIVTDNLNAELEVDYVVPPDIGEVYVTTKGKSETATLTWDIGIIPAHSKAKLVFYISTDINPGGKQEYTTPGDYEINSGARYKYRWDGKQYTELLPPITITVYLPD
ncbi:MAG: hypothetical protein ACFFDT_25435 [Candidatus Hodarchaeota archaeon]